MKFPLPKKRRYRIYLYILSILIILFALDLLLVRIGRHITLAKDTTYITSPLKPDGTPDYIQAIDDTYSAGITDENNAAPLLLAAFPGNMLPTSTRDQIYARLHMPPNPQSVPFGSYDNTESDIDELALCRKSLWKSADHPALTQWIQSATPALTILHQAAQRPRYYVPYDTPRINPAITFDLLPNIRIGNYRALTNAACARAMLRANSGDLDGARADLLDVHHLARLFGQGQFLIERLVSVAVEHTAYEADATLANSNLLSSIQAREFLADLDSLPPLPSVADSLYTERYTVLDALSYTSRHGIGSALGTFGWTDLQDTLAMRLLNYMPVNINGTMRLANNYFDQLTAAAKAATYPQQIAQERIVEMAHDKLQSPSLPSRILKPADLLVGQLTGSFNVALRRDPEQRMQFNLTRLALALSAYHADHHTYPPTLTTLSPAYLPSIPEDLFINQPLHYQPSPTLSSYLLYSVGPNMRDDNGRKRGQINPAYPDHPQSDDLAISVPLPLTP